MWNIQDCYSLLKDALARGESIVLACKCTVRYSGRAESWLDTGDRVIIIKGDRALLVHQPQGSAPVNYMKPDAHHEPHLDNGKLILRSTHSKNKEAIEIGIEKVYFFNSHRLEDGQSISVQGTEEDMSDMLFENPELVEPGFKPVSREEQTKYGFVDLLGVDNVGKLTVVECKRYRAELAAVTQLRRYVEKIAEAKGIARDQVRGIMAAPKITPNAERMLNDWGFTFVSVLPPKYHEAEQAKQSTLDGFGN